MYMILMYMARQVIFHFNQNFVILLISLTNHDPTIIYLFWLFILLLKSRKLYPDKVAYLPASNLSLLLIYNETQRSYPDLGCLHSYPSLGSSSYLSSSLKPSMMTQGEHDPFFLWSPISALMRTRFRVSLGLYYLYKYQFPKQMLPPW